MPNDAHRTPRQDFRVLTRRRSGYEGTMIDIQLQLASSGALVWSRTFSDESQAHEFATELGADLDTLDNDTFRRKYSVPSTA